MDTAGYKTTTPFHAISPFYLSHHINSTRFNAWHILLFVEQRSLHDCRNICLIKYKRKLKILRIIFVISKPSEYVYTAVYNTVMDHVLNWKPGGTFLPRIRNVLTTVYIWSHATVAYYNPWTELRVKVRKYKLLKMQDQIRLLHTKIKIVNIQFEDGLLYSTK